MRVSGRILAPCSLVVILLGVFLPAADAAAQELHDETRLLAAKLEFIQLFERKLPDLPYHDGAYSELQDEISAKREWAREQGEAALGEELLSLEGDARFAWAMSRKNREDLVGAANLFREITGAIREGGQLVFPAEKRTQPHFQPSVDALGEISEADGDARLAEGNKAAALAAYEDAITAYGASGDAAAERRVQGKRIDLLGEQGITAFNQDRFDDAYRYLKDLAGKNPPGFEDSEAYRYWQRLKDETSVLTFDEIDVPPQVKGTPLSSLTVRLDAAPGGKGIPAGPFFAKKRWLNGDYTAVLSNGRAELMRLPVTVPSSGPVRVPALFPDDMVFIPAAPSRSVSRPFFIDQHEVTVAQYRDTMADGRFRGDPANLPANEITYAQAKAYASKAGKQLPTEDQWKWAVFGATGNPYPWGRDGRNLRNYCNIQTGRLANVGSKPAGRSKPFGLDDAAGNVWEWLRDPDHPERQGGWAIGGGCNSRFLEAPERMRPKGWDENVNYLEHRQPDWIIYTSVLKGTRQTKYDRYKIDNNPNDLKEVGIRCVIEL